MMKLDKIFFYRHDEGMKKRKIRDILVQLQFIFKSKILIPYITASVIRLTVFLPVQAMRVLLIFALMIVLIAINSLRFISAVVKEVNPNGQIYYKMLE